MQAFWLAFAESFDSYRWFEDHIGRLEAITLEDVHEAAARYLRRQSRTVGYFVPQGGDDAEAYVEEDEE
jgi:predicted Zn-dependent peptidase